MLLLYFFSGCISRHVATQLLYTICDSFATCWVCITCVFLTSLHRVEWNHLPLFRGLTHPSSPSAAYIRLWTGSALVQAITWTSAGSLSIGIPGKHFSDFRIVILSFSLKNAFEIVVCQNGGHYVQGEMSMLYHTPNWQMICYPATRTMLADVHDKWQDIWCVIS